MTVVKRNMFTIRTVCGSILCGGAFISMYIYIIFLFSFIWSASNRIKYEIIGFFKSDGFL